MNVVLFYTTRRLLPAESVFPTWRTFLPAKWVSAPSPRTGVEAAEKSFACRAAAHVAEANESLDTVAQEYGEEDSIYMPSSRAKAHQSLRFKIDNHVDNTLTIQSQDDTFSRSSMALSFDTIMARPQPAVLVNTRAVDPFATVSSRGSVTSSILTGETIADSEVLGHEQQPSSSAPR